MKKIIIVGGGAAGLFLACLLANNSNYQCTILEKNERVGKKLLVTGNGKCNLSNETINENCYNHKEIFSLIQQFNVQQTIAYFSSLGLLIKKDEQGRYYPASESSNTVLDILRSYIEQSHIPCICNCKIEKIEKKSNQFFLTDQSHKVYSCDVVVLACGGKSYYASCNSYDLVHQLKLKTTDLFPSLVGLKTKENLVSIENLRCKARVSLFQNEQEIYTDQGEILFKKNGLSGIVTFQMCSYYNRLKNKNHCTLMVDLLPEYTPDDLMHWFINQKRPFKHLLDGVLLKMLAQYVYKQLKTESIDELIYFIKHLPFHIESSFDFTNAQVTSGGVVLDEMNLNTMESKKIKGLYIIGELLDVDGICGGYNLQFAWSSAAICAKHLEERMVDNDKK